MADTQNTTSISQIIAQETDKLVNHRLRSAPYDRTYTGIISDVLFYPDTDVKDVEFGQYKVRFAGMEKTVRIGDDIVHAVGERVQVRMLENNPNRLVIIPSITNVTPYKYKWDYDNNGDKDKSIFTAFTKVKTVKQEYYSGAEYETTREYEVTFKNKGKDNETPIKIKMPNGEEIELEGFGSEEEGET